MPLYHHQVDTAITSIIMVIEFEIKFHSLINSGINITNLITRKHENLMFILPGNVSLKALKSLP